MVVLAVILTLWALVTLTGWYTEPQSLGGPPAAQPWVLGGAWLTPVVEPGADPRPIVGCVLRWPDLDDPEPDCCTACGAVVVVHCRGPPPGPRPVVDQCPTARCPLSPDPNPRPAAQRRRARPPAMEPPTSAAPRVEARHHRLASG